VSATSPIAFWVGAVCAWQGVVTVVALLGRPALAAWGNLLCAMAVLSVVSASLGSQLRWGALRPLEIAFLAGNLVAIAWGIRLVWGRRHWRLALGGLWLLNTVLCATLAYLAFVFSLF
jgi:hypothetical protein